MIEKLLSWKNHVVVVSKPDSGIAQLLPRLYQQIHEHGLDTHVLVTPTEGGAGSWGVDPNKATVWYSHYDSDDIFEFELEKRLNQNSVVVIPDFSLQAYGRSWLPSCAQSVHLVDTLLKSPATVIAIDWFPEGSPLGVLAKEGVATPQFDNIISLKDYEHGPSLSFYGAADVAPQALADGVEIYPLVPPTSRLASS